jgi:hypothetical protein
VVDLNLWELAYDDVVLEFGTHDSGHPFTRQVKVGPVEVELGDLPHPMANGLTFGRDFTRGRVLEFVGAHLSTMALPASRRWEQPMDDSAPFEAAWQGESLQAVDGKMATLANLDRGRLVYGRPRPYVADHELARKGWLTYACSFATVDDRFYGTDEKVLVAGVDPGTAYAFAFPVAFPYQGVTPSETRAWVDNAGTRATWPVVEFLRGTRPRVELLDAAGGVLWWLEVDRVLDHNDDVVIDCRPWRRTVKLNGNPAPGLLRGTALDRCRVPPGAHEVRLETTDPTGLAEVGIRWRDAYGSL